jgi:NDP-sugar pyrophosphorylase family protein
MKPNVVIPMAGLGSRFTESGYTLPKPLIRIFGKPMIQLVVDSLKLDANYIFIVQKEHRIKFHLDDVLDDIAPGCKIIEVDGVTDGAARTVLMAKDLINNDVPLIISNSDQVVVWDSFIFTSILASHSVIVLFNADESKWSYAKIDELGLISEVAEKQVISNNASVGIYGWKTGSDYIKYAEQMIAKDIRTNDEFYIAPVYNEAILDGEKIIPYFVDEMHGVGTPEDMNKFIKDKVK